MGTTTDKIALALLGVVVSSILGGVIAVIAMGQLRADFDPVKMPEYFWFYRNNSYVMGWLLKGIGIAFILYCAVVAAAVLRPRKLHGEARWAREAEIAKADLRAKKGILLGRKGGKPICFGGTEHVLLEAPTRSGKGVGVVIPNLLEWPDSVVVLDVKQENWDLTAGYRREKLGQGVALFDPLDTSGRTVRYNPLAYINRHDEIEVINELQKIAAMLFPSAPGENSFWMDAARTAFIGVGAYVAATAIDGAKGRPFTIGEIYRNLTVGNPQRRFPQLIEQRKNEGRPLSAPCVSALNDFTSSSDNTFSGIRQSVTSRLGLWLNPYVDAATSESDFDMREFRQSRLSLYLGVSPDNLERVADLYNLLFQQLIDLNVRELPTKDRNNVQLLLLLDEFARLGRASVIASGFSYVAGYGIRLLPVIQSRSQLRSVYGRDVTDEIVANCGVEVVFTPKELSVANEVSERLGYYTFVAKSRSHKTMDSWDGSVSKSDQRRALMLPQELMLMGPDDIIVMRSGIPAVKGDKIRYYLDEEYSARAALPAPEQSQRVIDMTIAAEAAKAFEADMTETITTTVVEEMSDEEASAETLPAENLAEKDVGANIDPTEEPNADTVRDMMDEVMARERGRKAA